MTPETAVAVLGAVTALVIAVTGLIVQLRAMTRMAEAKLSDLVDATRSAPPPYQAQERIAPPVEKSPS